MATYFFISLAVFIVSFFICIVNMVYRTKKIFSNGFDGFNGVGKTFMIHFLFGAIAWLSMVACIIFGIIWIVKQFA